MDKTIKYKTDELTIIWKPSLCTHAGICVKTLPKVYNPKEKPWCKPSFASTKELIDQIKACPSGALSYELNEQ